jgi:hypothetical protein
MTASIHYHKLIFLSLLAGAAMTLSCNKGDFLGKKPSSELVVPSTLEDFQTLLDNDVVMSETPELGDLSADNFYLDYSFWQSLEPKEHNAYAWAPDIYQGLGDVEDWNIPYQQVLYANVVLDGLPGVAVDSLNQQQWNTLKGSAYFIRAYAFYNIAQVFAPVYNSGTAMTDLGIPLRLSSDVNPASTRLPLKVTYDQILSDLQQASSLLPMSVPTANLNRPSKPAALAMLARVYLSMGGYGQAGVYADSCLKAYDSLYDYNLISNRASLFPFKSPNSEIIYESHMLGSSGVFAAFLYPHCVVDSSLYNSYASNDLRSSVFYSSSVNPAGLPTIKASYNASIYPFTGLADDEVYLIRAECSARADNTMAAMKDLNAVLAKRWLRGTFIEFTAGNGDQALALILSERRKELAFRGLRWTDLRRLNRDGANITLTRLLNGVTSQLLPGDLRYVLPIPPDVVNLGGIKQNPR